MITHGILYLVTITLEVLVIMTVLYGTMYLCSKGITKLYEVTDKWHR